MGFDGIINGHRKRERKSNAGRKANPASLCRDPDVRQSSVHFYREIHDKAKIKIIEEYYDILQALNDSGDEVNDVNMSIIVNALLKRWIEGKIKL